MLSMKLAVEQIHVGLRLQLAGRRLVMQLVEQAGSVGALCADTMPNSKAEAARIS